MMIVRDTIAHQRGERLVNTPFDFEIVGSGVYSYDTTISFNGLTINGRLKIYTNSARAEGYINNINIGANLSRGVLQLKIFNKSTVIFSTQNDQIIHFQLSNQKDFDNFRLYTGL